MVMPWLEPAFSNGEIDPELFGRVDVERFHTAAATIRNAFVNFRGGANSRAGTEYVLMSKQYWLNPGSPPRLITFNFSLQQQFALEFGDLYMRIYENGAPVVEAPHSISGVTLTNPCIINVASPLSFFAVGDWILISGCVGADELNGNVYQIGAINNTLGQITLADFDGDNIDAMSFEPYIGSGEVQRIYTVVSPYLATDAWDFKFTQSANVLTITNPNFPPYNLNRFGPLNWVFQQAVIGPKISRPTGVVAKANAVAADVQAAGGFMPALQPAAYAYEVTAVSRKTGEESEASDVANVTNSVDMAATLGSITITWNQVPGAAYYYVYRAPTSYATSGFSDPAPANAEPVPVGSLFGVVSQVVGTQLVDTNLTPDFQQSPPMAENPLAPGQITDVISNAPGTGYTHASLAIATSTGSGFLAQAVIVNGGIQAWVIVNHGAFYAPTDFGTVSGDGHGATVALTIGPQTGTYPSIVSYFQQRRVYADSFNEPDTYWMSQSGAYDNFDVSIPVGDTDAITGTPSAETVDGIQWMLEMPLGLVTFTGAQVLQVTASGTFISSPAAITPSNQLAVPQSTVGSSSTLAPIRIDWNILHYEADNTTLRELQYQIWFNIYISRDISWQSSHLLAGYQVIDRAWTRRPNYVLWSVRNDGVLLSLTYVKDQEVNAWAKHTTQGQFLSVTAVYESPVDILYCAVQRQLPHGGWRFFIERMNPRIWYSNEDPWCVDCGVGSNVPLRSGRLAMSAASGTNVSFNSDAGQFQPSDVGATIRAGGGIAVVTDYESSGSLMGDWVFPCQDIIPDSPTNQPQQQQSGSWSIRHPIVDVTGLPPYSAGAILTGLADGIPVGRGSPTGNLVVEASGGSPAVGGKTTLPFPASWITIGFGFGVQVQSIYLEVGNPTVQGRVKSLNAITCRVAYSAPLKAGANKPDASTMAPKPIFESWDTMWPLASSPGQLPTTYVSPGTYLLDPTQQQQVQPLFTGDLRFNIPASWQKRGQAACEQRLPQPMNLLAFMPEFDEGDVPEQGYSQRPPRAPTQLAGMMQRWPQQGPRG